jgi:hypothetical protein
MKKRFKNLQEKGDFYFKKKEFVRVTYERILFATFLGFIISFLFSLIFNSFFLMILFPLFNLLVLFYYFYKYGFVITYHDDIRSAEILIVSRNRFRFWSWFWFEIILNILIVLYISWFVFNY